MEKLKDIKSEIYNYLFESGYKKECLSGRIRPFDEDFYKQFDGMYYNGLPIYYYLEKLNMNKCYDTSAILALAIGEKANICRGELTTMSNIDKEPFGHGWVEVEDKVYDTSWQIILDKKLYYNLFGVKRYGRRSYKEFFEDCKGMSDWNIHSKEYYENKFIPCVNLSIFQAHQIAEIYIQNPSNEEELKFYLQLRKDLPDFKKLKLMPDINRADKSVCETFNDEEPNK